jgi:hypothetical protein
MLLFVSIYLSFVFCASLGLWVFKDRSQLGARFVFTCVTVVEALLRVIIGAWWLKAASPRLALVFVEVDILTITVLGLLFSVFPGSFVGSLQFQLTDTSLSDEVVLRIFAGASLKEASKFVCYILPTALGQVRCASHLMFTGLIAGALSMLYIDIFGGSGDGYNWEKFLLSLLYTLMYTLWTSMGCAILCRIKQGLFSIYRAPLVLIVPIVFHSGYLMAVSGQTVGWLWALIVVLYWIISALVLKSLLGRVWSYTANDRFGTVDV